MSRRSLGRVALLTLVMLCGCHHAVPPEDTPAPRFTIDDSIVVILHLSTPEGAASSRVTARIADIRSDGTLVIDGRRHYQGPDGSLDLALTGLVKPQDVAQDGTVNDAQVEELHFTTSRVDR